MWAAPDLVRETTHGVRERRLLPAGGSVCERRRSVGRLLPVPPALSLASHVPGHQRARQGDGLLRAGRLVTEPASDGQRRRSHRHQPALRQAPGLLPDEGHRRAAARRCVVPADRRMPATSSAPATASSTSRSTAATTSSSSAIRRRSRGDRRLHRPGRHAQHRDHAADPQRRSESAVRQETCTSRTSTSIQWATTGS